MICCGEEHLTPGRTFVHVAEPQATGKPLGTLDCEVDAPCVLSTNNFRQMRDTGNNVTGRTVKLRGNGHGVSVFTLNRDASFLRTDRFNPELDYASPFGFAVLTSDHLKEHRESQGLDDVDDWICMMKIRVKRLQDEKRTPWQMVNALREKDKDFQKLWLCCMDRPMGVLQDERITCWDLVQNVREQSTYIPLPLAFQYCESLSTAHAEPSELEEPRPGAMVRDDVSISSDSGKIHSTGICLGCKT